MGPPSAIQGSRLWYNRDNGQWEWSRREFDLRYRGTTGDQQNALRLGDHGICDNTWCPPSQDSCGAFTNNNYLQDENPSDETNDAEAAYAALSVGRRDAFETRMMCRILIQQQPPT